eukprot:TRINITY_DN6612_c0_g1_i1.p1 TRINITY_DN6612_c0_g1~~TRINITY_DN6612_c0_g1_i1.p1  ORF type:complete len:1159 (+),score=408.01 TRINITY_DN6612_c0_g1_i1:54-3530(+)
MKRLHATDKKSEHVRVFVRARPLQDGEMRAPITLTERDVSAKTKTSRGQNNYSFKKVFSTDSTQEEIFETACKPLVSDMLKGFSCTIFAYGQTNSGKTHSMMGDLKSESNQGLTPRACKHIFNELMKSSAHFTVRLSCVELYKEEFYDMLVPADAEKKQKLKLFQDGKSGVVMKGVEEMVVSSPADVIKQLESAIARRATAATGMNSRSSRSHFIATISVTVKEETMNGEDLFKMGKLHLVDLAGSESAKRTDTHGTDRQSEAAAINKSLLTLGRVISSLSSPDQSHTPYRESALTRLLSDALGGRSKTSIITTISLAKLNLDETLSTLEYASSARKIENDPEMNRVLSGNQLVCDYESELVRLRTELTDQRNGTGVFVSEERYEMMQNRLRELEADQVLKSEKAAELQDKLNGVWKQIKVMEAKQAEKNILLFHHQQSETALVECIQQGISKEQGLHNVIKNRDIREGKNFQTIGEAVETQLLNTNDLNDAISQSKDAVRTIKEQSIKLTNAACQATSGGITDAAQGVIRQEETTSQLYTALENRVNTSIGTQQYAFEAAQKATGSAVDGATQAVSQLSAQVQECTMATTDKHCKKVTAAVDDVMGRFFAATASAKDADQEALQTLMKDMMNNLKQEVVGSMKNMSMEISEKASTSQEAAVAVTAEGNRMLDEGRTRLAEVLDNTENGVKMSTENATLGMHEEIDTLKCAIQESAAEDINNISNELFSLEERERAAIKVASSEGSAILCQMNATDNTLREEIQKILLMHKQHMQSLSVRQTVVDETLRSTLQTITQERVCVRASLDEAMRKHEALLDDGLQEILSSSGSAGEQLSAAVSVEVKKAHSVLDTIRSNMADVLAKHGSVHNHAATELALYSTTTLANFEQATNARAGNTVEQVELFAESKAQERTMLAEQVKQAMEGVAASSRSEVTQEMHSNMEAMTRSGEEVIGKVQEVKTVVASTVEEVAAKNGEMKKDVENLGRMGLEKASEVSVEVRGRLSGTVDMLQTLKTKMETGMESQSAEIIEGIDAASCVLNRIKETVTFLGEATERHVRGETPSPSSHHVPSVTSDYAGILAKYDHSTFATATNTPVPRKSTLDIYSDLVPPPPMGDDTAMDEGDYVPVSRPSPSPLIRKALNGASPVTPLGLRTNIVS